MAAGAQALDVLVVGGGPVGLAVAIAARARGLAVAVLDRARPPIDKACGEGVMPDGVRCLEALGVAVPEEERHAFHGIEFVDGDRRAVGRFGSSSGFGARRPALHRALVGRAEAVGATLRWGEAVAGLDWGPRRTASVRTGGGERVAARFVVAADGLASHLRSWAGLEAAPARRRRFGVRRHYAIEPWTDLVEVHFHAAGRSGVEAYVTPTGRREVGVAMLWDGAAGSARFDALLGRFPALAARLEGCPPSSRDRGAGPLERGARAVVRGNLALVGDAAGYIDAITGEGLSVGLRQATALADALAASDLGRYRRAHRRLVRVPNAGVRLLLALERRPGVRRRAIARLAADHGSFDRLVRVHGGLLPPRRVGLRGVFHLAAAFAAAGGR